MHVGSAAPSCYHVVPKLEMAVENTNVGLTWPAILSLQLQEVLDPTPRGFLKAIEPPNKVVRNDRNVCHTLRG